MKLPQSYLAASSSARPSQADTGKALNARIDMSAEVVLANKCPECKQQMTECFISDAVKCSACVPCRITLPMKDDDGPAGNQA